MLQDSPPGRGRESPVRRLGHLLAVVVVLLSFSSASRGQGLTKAVSDKVKNATVFIKLKIGRGQGSGSGFVMRVTGDTVLIMTNRHVASPDSEELPAGAKVELSVVFRSGTPQEQELPARLLAHDEREIRDLAIIEVKGVRAPPIPISAEKTVDESTLTETMRVYTLGFPLGGMIQQAVGDDKGNPTVTVNEMSISRLPLGEHKKLARESSSPGR